MTFYSNSGRRESNPMLFICLPIGIMYSDFSLKARPLSLREQLSLIQPSPNVELSGPEKPTGCLSDTIKSIK